MVHVANTTGNVSMSHTSDALRWAQELEHLRESFDSQFFEQNQSSSTASDSSPTFNAFIPDGSGAGYAMSAAPGTRQTVNALALTAGVGSAQHRAAASDQMLQDVIRRNFSLTVGAIGQKRLLNILSEMDNPEGHDAALRIALVRLCVEDLIISFQQKQIVAQMCCFANKIFQADTFPGWGYWLTLNATTCWESWTSMLDKSNDHHLGSRNHGWLCGGLAEWLYASLGGIQPASDGFGTVSIAPKISSTPGLG